MNFDTDWELSLHPKIMKKHQGSPKVNPLLPLLSPRHGSRHIRPKRTSQCMPGAKLKRWPKAIHSLHHMGGYGGGGGKTFSAPTGLSSLAELNLGVEKNH